MKYLNRLFAFDDRQSHQESSTAAALTSSLYSVTFVPESSPSKDKEEGTQHRKKGEQTSSTSTTAKITFKRRQISNIAQTHTETDTVDPIDSRQDSALSLIGAGDRRRGQLTAAISRRQEEVCDKSASVEDSSLIGYLLSATIGSNSRKSIGLAEQQYNSALETTKVSHTTNQQIDHHTLHTADKTITRELDPLEAEDDWILVEEDLVIDHHHQHSHYNKDLHTNTITPTTNNSYNRIPLTQLKQMALETTDIELIKGSWIPVRKDPTASGVLLFKGLFIKFPQYLKFFPQFSDLDLERMHENKRLLRHAVKVIDTVTFVVDAIGDDSKKSQLNDALVNLVKSHLRRKIGVDEFRNLGVVLIDFICDVVGRGGAPSVEQQSRASDEQCQLNKSTTSESTNNTNSSSIDSETMTSALDKLRASSSPSSSSEEESYLSPNSGGTNNKAHNSSNYAKLEENNDGQSSSKEQDAIGGSCSDSARTSSSNNNNKEPKIDTNLHLVTAWTRLYNVIMDLVKREAASDGE